MRDAYTRQEPAVYRSHQPFARVGFASRYYFSAPSSKTTEQFAAVALFGLGVPVAIRHTDIIVRIVVLVHEL